MIQGKRGSESGDQAQRVPRESMIGDDRRKEGGDHVTVYESERKGEA